MLHFMQIDVREPSPKKFLYYLVALSVFVLVAYGASSFSDHKSLVSSQISTSTVDATQPESATSTGEVATTTNALVVRVVDGDTFAARPDSEDREFTIRMLGINSPETVDPRRPVECFGQEASARLKSLLDGKRVRLEADNQADERDKYGRLLRNVFLEDGADVNALMVRDGYAYAYLSFPLNARRKAELKKLQAEAKEAGRGLWAADACAKTD